MHLHSTELATYFSIAIFEKVVEIPKGTKEQKIIHIVKPLI